MMGLEASGQCPLSIKWIAADRRLLAEFDFEYDFSVHSAPFRVFQGEFGPAANVLTMTAGAALDGVTYEANAGRLIGIDELHAWGLGRLFGIGGFPGLQRRFQGVAGPLQVCLGHGVAAPRDAQDDADQRDQRPLPDEVARPPAMPQDPCYVHDVFFSLVSGLIVGAGSIVVVFSAARNSTPGSDMVKVTLTAALVASLGTAMASTEATYAPVLQQSRFSSRSS